LGCEVIALLNIHLSALVDCRPNCGQNRAGLFRHKNRSTPANLEQMKTSGARTALFGPYSLDLRSGELRKFGNKIRMGEQSFCILCLLLDANGEMVTREELRDKLWASDTFVDFDHGLNSAVQRLRDCLSDSAENARWIETVPRRGYRFVGRVDWQDDNKIALVVDSEPQAPETSHRAEAQTAVNEEAGTVPLRTDLSQTERTVTGPSRHCPLSK
jgi:DNA-binding winged helix-turn-helix (wHTH) protein